MLKVPSAKALIIVDYNLSRREDVRNISRYAKQSYALNTVLIRFNPLAVDYEISDAVVNLDPLQENFVQSASEALAQLGYDYIAGLVFSDNAVKTGADLLESLGLKTDCAKLAYNAFCKFEYRKTEQEIRKLLQPQRVFVPNFSTVSEINDLRKFIAENPGGVVIKPKQEGNNRGVILLEKPSEKDVELALSEVAPFLKGGIIVEQHIPFQDEFSFDGIGDCSFITEKFTASGRYPVEYGQLVPAHIGIKRETRITYAGQIANLISGQINGPFHNEIRVSQNDDQAAVIEANRRPAGMKIWSLAAKVFGEDLYHRWVDSTVLPEYHGKPLVANGSAMIIMLPSHRSLACEELYQPIATYIELLKQNLTIDFPDFFNQVEWLGEDILAKEGRFIHSPARDNSDFLAQIMLYHTGQSGEMKKMFNNVQNTWYELLMSFELQTKVASS